MKGTWQRGVLLWAGVLLLVLALHLLIWERSQASVLKENSWETEAFRVQRLEPELYMELDKAADQKHSFGELLTVTMLKGEFFPKQVNRDSGIFRKYKPEAYERLKQCYEVIWSDLVCFPVPDCEMSFENTWLAPRSYGGERRMHEGTDIFGSRKESGYYPVVSVTDGVVEEKGWLPLGGYRIGIRAPQGGYFYYAHLSSYEKKFQKGDSVTAGEILGYMGNTGYGPEGTKGKFPVHLHFGIYIETPKYAEMSVNPYWPLCALYKNNIRKYTY